MVAGVSSVGSSTRLRSEDWRPPGQSSPFFCLQERAETLQSPAAYLGAPPKCLEWPRRPVYHVIAASGGAHSVVLPRGLAQLRPVGLLAGRSDRPGVGLPAACWTSGPPSGGSPLAAAGDRSQQHLQQKGNIFTLNCLSEKNDF